MEKTWKPVVTGILNIVSGVIALIWFIMLISAIVVGSDLPGKEIISLYQVFFGA